MVSTSRIRVGLGLTVKLQQEVGRYVYVHLLAFAQYGHPLGLGHLHQSLGRVVQLLVVGHQGNVAVAETGVKGHAAVLHTHLGLLERHVLPARSIYDACIDQDCQQEIEQHTRYHNKESLPCRFGAEFPFLGRLFHLLGVHRLVDHAGNLAIAAQGKPPDAIFSVAPEAFLFLGLRRSVFILAFQFPGLAKTSDIFLGLPFEQLYPGVEEDVELLHLHSEDAGEEEVTELVDYDEESECQYQLGCFNQKCFHLNNEWRGLCTVTRCECSYCRRCRWQPPCRDGGPRLCRRGN